MWILSRCIGACSIFFFSCIVLDLKDKFYVGQETSIFGDQTWQGLMIGKFLPTCMIFRNPNIALVIQATRQTAFQPKPELFHNLLPLVSRSGCMKIEVVTFKVFCAHELWSRCCINCGNQEILLSEMVLEVCAFRQWRGGVILELWPRAKVQTDHNSFSFLLYISVWTWLTCYQCTSVLVLFILAPQFKTHRILQITF